MRFLVEVVARLPPDLDPERRAQLLDAELERGRELRDARVIEQIWRVPGTHANVGIWTSPDPTSLHEAISSLPLFPWLEVRAVPLARHPLWSE
jgi:muconolactone D-isomerase